MSHVRSWVGPLAFAASICAAMNACVHPPKPGPREKAAPSTATTADELQGPVGLAIDGNTVYVVDVFGKAIRRLDLPTRRLTTVATSRPLEGPSDVTVAHDHALVVMSLDGVVRVDPATGSLTMLATASQLQQVGAGRGTLTNVAVDPRGGVFVGGSGDIVRIDPSGRISPMGATKGPVGDMLADTSGHLYVSLAGEFAAEQRILRIDLESGNVATVVGPGTPVYDSAGARLSRVAGAYHLAWLGEDLLFSERTRLLRLDVASGDVRLVSKRHPEQAVWSGLVVAPDRSLIVADYMANQLRRIDVSTDEMTAITGRAGHITTILTHGISVYDSPPDETCSNDPGDAVVDVLVQDVQGGRVPGAVVRLYAPSGVATRDAAGREAMVFSDASGVARVRLAASGDYAILVMLHGFLPATSVVRLSTGCTARVPVRLNTSIKD